MNNQAIKEIVMFTVKGKNVLVTGANRGIGLAFIKELLAQGATKIYAASRDIKSLVDVVALNPERIQAIELDVTNQQQIAQLTKNIPSLDLLINNAGIANGCFNSADQAIDIARQEMETHYFGPMQVTQACLGLLKNSEHSAIVNISSVAALSNFPSLGPYSATKAALMSYSQGLRIELAADNIGVYCVYPGPTDTRLAPGDQMPKATTESVAVKTLEAMNNGMLDIYPDDFAQNMSALLFEHPDKLAQTFKAFHCVQ